VRKQYFEAVRSAPKDLVTQGADPLALKPLVLEYAGAYLDMVQSIASRAGSAVAADANTTTANQTPAAWERTYGGLGNETLLSMLGSANGGYLLVGASTGNGTGTEVYLVSTDSNGTAIREDRVPFGPGSPAMADRALDNGVVVVGGTGEAGSLSGDVALLRLAPDGRLLWTRSYSVGSGRENGDAVRQEADGGYFVAGTTETSTGGSPGPRRTRRWRTSCSGCSIASCLSAGTRGCRRFPQTQRVLRAATRRRKY
jgi:hypothetical protein